MSDTIIYDKRLLAHIVLEAETPLVISSGGKTALTDSAILKDINGYPYIPGSTIAGILRHCLGEEKAKDFFGLKDKKTTKGSKIIFSEGKIVGLDGKVLDGIVNGDTIFASRFQRLPKRNHVRLTSKGVAKDTGKFDEEVIYKGTRFAFDIEMVASGNEEQEPIFNDVLNELGNDTFRIGGGSRSGFGKIRVIEIKKKNLDLRQSSQLNEYLMMSSALNSNYDDWDSYTSTSHASAGWIKYDLTLTPVDFFSFGSGLGDNEVDATPVKESFIKWENGRGSFKDNALLIPATSLKGVLAHRVAFHYNVKHKVFAMPTPMEDFKEHTTDKNPAVRELFGYQDANEGQKCGACLFSDIIGEFNEKEKVFNHVKIDRFTSGAMDGALFSEKVIDGTDSHLHFKTSILIRKPGIDSKDFNEAIDCLEKALSDIDSGTLPLGGASGRGHGIFRCEYNKSEQ
ncbi:MAG: RAMP superfamily CRISPR-associated protein [Alistipes sp.]|nr:RAMP superfamily CRISPR-associated protein [Alistipes sp.]